MPIEELSLKTPLEVTDDITGFYVILWDSSAAAGSQFKIITSEDFPSASSGITEAQVIGRIIGMGG
jgi:hypothetical protein